MKKLLFVLSLLLVYKSNAQNTSSTISKDYHNDNIQSIVVYIGGDFSDREEKERFKKRIVNNIPHSIAIRNVIIEKRSSLDSPKDIILNDCKRENVTYCLKIMKVKGDFRLNTLSFNPSYEYRFETTLINGLTDTILWKCVVDKSLMSSVKEIMNRAKRDGIFKE